MLILFLFFIGFFYFLLFIFIFYFFCKVQICNLETLKLITDIDHLSLSIWWSCTSWLKSKIQFHFRGFCFADFGLCKCSPTTALAANLIDDWLNWNRISFGPRFKWPLAPPVKNQLTRILWVYWLRWRCNVHIELVTKILLTNRWQPMKWTARGRMQMTKWHSPIALPL